MRKALLVNDISEKPEHVPLIRKFASAIYGKGNYRIVGVSKIKKGVLEHLRKEVERRGKFKVGMVGSRGGAMLVNPADLKPYCDEVVRIPWSSHEKTRPIADVERALY